MRWLIFLTANISLTVMIRAKSGCFEHPITDQASFGADSVALAASVEIACDNWLAERIIKSDSSPHACVNVLDQRHWDFEINGKGKWLSLEVCEAQFRHIIENCQNRGGDESVCGFNLKYVCAWWSCFNLKSGACRQNEWRLLDERYG